MEGKVVLITGANAGIGFATAIAFAKLQPKLYIACRSREKGEKAVQDIIKSSNNQNVIFIQLDLNDLDSIDACAKSFLETEKRLDVLINNAGIMGTKTDNRSKQGFEMTFAVNYLGHFLLTMHLIPLLKNASPSRIINLTSLTHSRGRIDFNTLEYWRMLVQEGHHSINDFPLYTRSSFTPSLESVYTDSKLAIILFSDELASRVNHMGIVSNSMCPGVVATSILDDFNWFLRTFGPIVMKVATMAGIGVTAETSAKTAIMLGYNPQFEKVTGKYFTHGKMKDTHVVALDPIARKRLWRISEDLVDCRSRVEKYSSIDFVENSISSVEVKPCYSPTIPWTSKLWLVFVGILIGTCIWYLFPN